MRLTVPALLGLLAAAAAVLLPASVRDGLNGDPCRVSDECASGRICFRSTVMVGSTNKVVCDDPDPSCFCLRSDYLRRRCSTSTGCDLGERCFSRNNETIGLCYSCTAIKDEPGLTLFDEGNCNGETVPLPTPTTTDPTEGGLNGDSCRTSDDCIGVRNCIVASSVQSSTTTSCHSSDKQCICLRPNYIRRRCSTERENRCDVGERCFRETYSQASGLCYSCDALRLKKGAIFIGDGNCKGELSNGTTDPPTTTAIDPDAPPVTGATDPPPTSGGESDPATDTSSSSGDEPDPDPDTEGESPTPSPSPQNTPPPICVGVEHLAHLPATALVFRAHVEADVLCDARGSCATGGHVVVFGGRAMMMGTYCAMHGCASRRALVNSPRMAVGLRVASLTPGLQFTAFAARFESKAEEHVLRTLVHAGL